MMPRVLRAWSMLCIAASAVFWLLGDHDCGIYALGLHIATEIQRRK